MTQLRKQMLEEIQRRNYSHRTARTYVRIVRDFAECCRDISTASSVFTKLGAGGGDTGILWLPVTQRSGL